jgi:hypothetical protein
MRGRYTGASPDVDKYRDGLTLVRDAFWQGSCFARTSTGSGRAKASFDIIINIQYFIVGSWQQTRPLENVSYPHDISRGIPSQAKLRFKFARIDPKPRDHDFYGVAACLSLHQRMDFFCTPAMTSRSR